MFCLFWVLWLWVYDLACGLFCCDLMLGFAWLVWFVCLLFSFAWFVVLGLLLVVILLFWLLAR